MFRQHLPLKRRRLIMTASSAQSLHKESISVGCAMPFRHTRAMRGTAAATSPATCILPTLANTYTRIAASTRRADCDKFGLKSRVLAWRAALCASSAITKYRSSKSSTRSMPFIRAKHSWYSSGRASSGESLANLAVRARLTDTRTKTGRWSLARTSTCSEPIGATAQ